MSPQQTDQILEQWWNWSEQLSAKPVRLSPLGDGLTNQSYLLDSDLGKLVLRINNPNSETLGINRQREALILQSLEQQISQKIGPEVIFQEPQYRYMVYRFIEGNIWTAEQLSKPDNQKRLKQLIDQYQKIQLSIEHRNYKNYLLHYWQHLQEKSLVSNELEQQWSEFLPELNHADWSSCLSHHDLSPGNIIETPEGLRIIDWEYAHLGHPDLDWTLIKEGSNSLGSSHVSRLIYWINKLWHLVASHT